MDFYKLLILSACIAIAIADKNNVLGKEQTITEAEPNRLIDHNVLDKEQMVNLRHLVRRQTNSNVGFGHLGTPAYKLHKSVHSSDRPKTNADVLIKTQSDLWKTQTLLYALRNSNSPRYR